MTRMETILGWGREMIPLAYSTMICLLMMMMLLPLDGEPVGMTQTSDHLRNK